MTGRLISILLIAGLVLSSIAAIAGSVRIIIGVLLGVQWFWGGAFAAYVGPLCFAAALYLHRAAGAGRVVKSKDAVDA